ncbi:hypothetical protein [Cohnella lupini]|uniref:hypothetical protein n=1 Tax=Cohnella lupini TaxID=1294267 RepID=UPI000E285DD7|nr:hypothetical protein [Cohnella lupini]
MATNNQYPTNIKWYFDEQYFETMRESHEWAYSVPFNEIGNKYDGYITNDEKIASALVFELIRSNTIHGFRFNVHCDCEFPDGNIFFKVWVTN